MAAQHLQLSVGKLQLSARPTILTQDGADFCGQKAPALS